MPTKEEKTTVKETPEKTDTDALGTFFIDDGRRDAIMEDYADRAGLNPDEEASGDDETADISTETETTDDIPAGEEESTETSTEIEAAVAPAEEGETDEETPATEQDDEKTVPHGAFHEEREKRKALQGEVNDLQLKLNQLMKDNLELMDMVRSGQKPATEDADTSDDMSFDDFTDPNVKALAKEVRELRQFKEQFVKDNESNAQQQMLDRIENDKKTVDSELDKEGFPGFYIAQEAVKDVLRKMTPEELQRNDNPEGWKEIYKEQVWPDVQKKFGIVKKVANTEQKTELKKKAGLVDTPGKPIKEAPGKDEDKKTEKESYDDYLRMRRQMSFS